MGTMLGKRRAGIATVWLLASSLLAGCAQIGGHSDLEQYVAEVKARKGGRIEPVPEFRTYEGFRYAVTRERDPFTPTVSHRQMVASNNGISPDLNRNKEPLEQFPLDTLKFGGHLERNAQRWAIVTAPDGLVHRIQIGNHMGQNYGRVASITETSIGLVEIVPDGIGGWVEREAALKLDLEQ